VRVIRRLSVGGPARQAIQLTEVLAARGFGTELVSGVEGDREGRIESTVPVTVVPSLKREVDPRADLAAGRALHRLIRARRPDIVHTHMAKAGALGRLAAHRVRVPVVVHTFHGHVLDGYFSPPVARAFIAAERGLARWTTALIAVSAAVRDELLRLGIGRAEQWRVIPLGLDLEPLVAPAPDRAAARASLGLPPHGAVVGIVGRLVPIKDHATFLAAAVEVAAVRDDVRFAIVGDGELRNELEDKARHLLGDRVTFTGWVQDLPRLYAALDVVVLTSRNEGTPVALIEAAAAGKPVVATRVGGVTDVVRDGVTGALAVAGDIAGVSGELLKVLGDPGLARAHGDAARAHVRDRFSQQRLDDDIEALYRELLDRTIGSPPS